MRSLIKKLALIVILIDLPVSMIDKFLLLHDFSPEPVFILLSCRNFLIKLLDNFLESGNEICFFQEFLVEFRPLRFSFILPLSRLVHLFREKVKLFLHLDVRVPFSIRDHVDFP